MPQYVLWVEIESRHMNKLAKTWTIICIILQSTVIGMIPFIYVNIGLWHFSDDVKLTPLLLHYAKGSYEFYALFVWGNDKCAEEISDTNPDRDCLCEIVGSINVFWSSTVLNLVLLFGMFNNAVIIYLKG